MAISLKNIEDRVKALEESGVSGWTKGSNSNGYWAKETTTGLIIQWGIYSKDNNYPKVTLPIAFTSTTYTVTTAMYGGNYEGGCSTRSYSTTSFYKQSQRGAPFTWIAIGYLITDRLLNILYKAFARNIYTQLWQKLVSNFLQVKQRRCKIIMAISLKNIDDRLKVVESKITSSAARVVKLYSGHNANTDTNVVLSEAYTNFDLICFQSWDLNGKYASYMTTVTKTMTVGCSLNIRETDNLTSGRYTYCLVKSATQFQLSGKYVGFGDIYGLKLYYNFSYNIIYKILSSIKFKISQIISSPKITRRCKKYGY